MLLTMMINDFAWKLKLLGYKHADEGDDEANEINNADPFVPPDQSPDPDVPEKRKAHKRCQKGQ
jgi:hypothetical protein